MNKVLKRIWLIVLVAAGIIAGYQGMKGNKHPVDSLLAFYTSDDGRSIVSWLEDDHTVIARVNHNGKIEKYYSYETETKEHMYNVRGVAASGDYVYVLRNRTDRYNGEVLSQELMVLDFTNKIVKQRKVFDLTGDENYRYGWIHAAGDAITLIATDPYESSAVRRNYEFGSVLEDTLTLKTTRTYPLRVSEGIYQAIGNSTNLVYISDSGKIFCADEEKVQEVYPARDLEVLMYPTYIAYAESGYIYLGEHETGDVIKLNLENGDEESILNGNSPFSGSSLYTPRDVIVMSMANLNNFTALVKNGQTNEYNLLIAKDGVAYTVTEFQYNALAFLQTFFRQWLIYAAVATLIYILLTVFVSSIKGGHTIMERLISATVPMLIVTMLLFGVISFQYYKEAINENFVKQAVDEGNMLAALFGQESFNEIEYPYDYSGEAYTYLSQQMATRDLYTRAIYNENGDLYIGVDAGSPCFYPFDIWMNQSAEGLYRKAALTGESVTGTIRDHLGERLICVTPIGGLSGETVYLLETGIFTANISAYTATYVKDFAIVSLAFLIIIMVVLMVLFYHILFPLGEMRRQMQLFADGDRHVRIQTSSEDELTGIARVFNKMADDIDVQILNLERLSDTYYRFVPPSIIGMLGKNNLASLTLGSNVKGDFAVLNIRMKMDDQLSLDQTEKLMNRFFNTVNRFAQQHDIISIVDDANLQSMMLICQNGVDSAIIAALTILARIDADNKVCGAQEQLDVMFVMDQAEVYFGICGDEERYIPVVIAPEFEKLLANYEFLKQMGSRFLLTEFAYRNIVNVDSYANRYIGRLDTGDFALGLYDVYDDRTAEQIRLMKHTQHIFDKAMELFEKGLYYEAKNMYAMVLRENQQDMVAKHYVFQCEALQERN